MMSNDLAFAPLLESHSNLENVKKGELLDLLIEVMEHISEAMVVYDQDGRLVTCNRNFCQMYGYMPEEVMPGVHFRDLGKIDVERGNVAIGDEYGCGNAYLKRKAEYRETLKGSFIVKLKDGRWIKTTDRRLPNGGFVSVQTDISSEKRAQEALRIEKERAEQALAENSALSIELARKVEQLAEIASTDRLTGLANRSKIEEYLSTEIKRSGRSNDAPFGLIMLDIDHFKQVNDIHGHDIGDQLLIEFSQILTQNIRATDFVGRWGGEEFMIICPDTTLQGAKKLAEGLRLVFEAHLFSTVGIKTSSFGISVYVENDDTKTIIKRADSALYQAKRNGRNTVVAQ